MRIVLGVTGGIAAYKAAHVLRGLRERGHAVRVVPTEAALRFVGAPTWEALSGEPVSTTVFEGVENVEHVRIGHEADLVVVAPATADLLARARAGMADDLLTATLLTATCPVVVAPAMHTEMWFNAATVDNVATLRARGWTVIEPASGRLTGADTGPGRLPEPDDIIQAALAATGRSAAPDSADASTVTPVAPADDSRADESRADGALSGASVIVSAGGTREPLDPVRFLGNRSSGKQGAALAAAAATAGARVTLIAANVDSDVLASLPAGVDIEHVSTTAELEAACTAHASSADVIVMAAAVSDYRPAAAAQHKMKKTGDDLTIALVENPDILRGLVELRDAGRTRTGQLLVGFAAETGSHDTSAESLAQAKLLRKGCDLLVFNDVSGDRAFGHDDNAVVVYRAGADGAEEVARSEGSKAHVSNDVIAAVAAERSR
ncbi:MAG: bifunctional phosphopantothenoylcysteine decarboxylase/phosphopantothenate synthase [Brevibacterium yomogidense]|uniref:bifunctional phosphopantothenoylcysteine decarboxylase/phosphopantothenate synthase n=1 Tax=Brevibacterium sp. Mu109 TaxID=1255669 RepID=UPI000C669273|nr:bifunctional phosphopantothenoylcysteine decarboxylase/phosphopantothenate synthase [Brevibacterium sp. Mu109]SMX67792.1 phosphopantothenoylcysteine decarboxylase / phosphopantothenate--cysteine ligase [Brevibacterium sp. Mu109]